LPIQPKGEVGNFFSSLIDTSNEKMRKSVSIIYFHRLELFTTTDHGIRLSSSLQKPELHGLIKAFFVYTLNNHQNSDCLYIYIFFCICNSAVFYRTVFYIHIYFTVYVQILLSVCSAFELPVLINLSRVIHPCRSDLAVACLV